jgi:four helix bundle protein
VPVSRFEDLTCWRLSDELKKRVYALIFDSNARSDLRFCSQLMDSAASGPANIAEAFGYYRHGDAARLARVARASLMETKNHVTDGVDRRHWTAATASPVLHLADRAIGATTNWLHYLSRSDAP